MPWAQNWHQASPRATPKSHNYITSWTTQRQSGQYSIQNPNQGNCTYAVKFHRKMAKFLNNNATRTIEITWCPSHCKIQGNNRADELAKEATQLAWSSPIGTSRAFALRRAKATTRQRGPANGRERQKRDDSHSRTESPDL